MNEVYLVPKDELYHYGVKGMKWGHRKNIYDVNANYYNNRASKLTAKANRNRTMASMNKAAAGQSKGLISKANNLNANYYNKRADKLQAKANRNKTMASMNEAASKQRQEAKAAQTPEQIAAKRKKALKVGAAVAGTALAAYGAYKLNKFVKDENAKLMSNKGHEAALKYLNENRSSSLGITTFKDGSVSVGRTVNGRFTETGPVGKDWGETVYNHYKEIDNLASLDANKIRSDYANKARNAKFKEAAKNVINDRVDTYKRTADAKRAVKEATTANLKKQQEEYLKRMRAGAQQRNTRHY